MGQISTKLAPFARLTTTCQMKLTERTPCLPRSFWILWRNVRLVLLFNLISPPPWASGHTKSLSPRRPPASRPQGPGSIYYYSDTLRGRKGDNRDTTESDSGISGEGTPHHVTQLRARARLVTGALEAHAETPVQTQVFLSSLSARQKRGAVKL